MRSRCRHVSFTSAGRSARRIQAHQHPDAREHERDGQVRERHADDEWPGRGAALGTHGPRPRHRPRWPARHQDSQYDCCPHAPMIRGRFRREPDLRQPAAICGSGSNCRTEANVSPKSSDRLVRIILITRLLPVLVEADLLVQPAREPRGIRHPALHRVEREHAVVDVQVGGMPAACPRARRSPSARRSSRYARLTSTPPRSTARFMKRR